MKSYEMLKSPQYCQLEIAMTDMNEPPWPIADQL
jgi:hypothetical protein